MPDISVLWTPTPVDSLADQQPVVAGGVVASLGAGAESVATLSSGVGASGRSSPEVDA